VVADKGVDEDMEDETGANDNELLVPLTATNRSRHRSLHRTKSLYSQNAQSFENEIQELRGQITALESKNRMLL
jgi:hypothetical protein